MTLKGEGMITGVEPLRKYEGVGLRAQVATLALGA